MEPVRMKKDVAVIGGGPGGYVAAIRLGQLGKKVLLLEKEKIGGTCLNFGCIPSKAIISFASLLDKIKKADIMGLEISNPKIDLKKFQAWKSGIVNRLTSGIATLCKGVGVEIVNAEASLQSPHEVTFFQNEKPFVAEVEHIVIATGAKPISLPGFPFDGKQIISSKESLDLEEVPETLLVIGGGIIGLELGTAFQKLGSQLIVVELLPQLLNGCDPDLVRYVERGLKKRGGLIFLNSKAKHVGKKGNKLFVSIETPDGTHNIEASLILVAIGVKPNTEKLSLEKIGVKTDPKGFILVNEEGRTTIPNIFAIGDVKGPPYLAHKAFKEGEVCAEVIAGLSRALDYRAMPSAVFTDPEIAFVGLSEQEAQKEGRKVIVGKYPMGASGRALSMGEAEGLMKVVVDEKSQEVLGIHLVGPEVSELISEGALALEMGAFALDVASTIHPHPTLSEGIMEAFKQTLGEAIHIQNIPGRLTEMTSLKH
jgi:dihydrolipoamide dehydrogenase